MIGKVKKCQNCMYEWISRVTYPKQCPHCRILSWNVYRDKDRCEVCKKAYLKLEVHHKDGDQEHNWKDNTILICRWCHAFIHRPTTNGKKRRTGLYSHGNLKPEIFELLSELREFWLRYKGLEVIK